MLELLWVHDADEAQSEVIQPIHLWERWKNRSSGACPFGFCFRSTANSNSELPFSTWEYQPPYLPKPLSCSVATNSDVLTEPMLFYIAFAKRQDTYPADKLPPLEHRANLREVTRLELATPYVHNSSPALQAVVNANLITTQVGEEYFVTLGFDGETQRQQMDFRPGLPLIFSW